MTNPAKPLSKVTLDKLKAKDDEISDLKNDLWAQLCKCSEDYCSDTPVLCRHFPNRISNDYGWFQSPDHARKALNTEIG